MYIVLFSVAFTGYKEKIFQTVFVHAVEFHRYSTKILPGTSVNLKDVILFNEAKGFRLKLNCIHENILMAIMLKC